MRRPASSLVRGAHLRSFTAAQADSRMALTLSRDEMLALGRQVVEMIVDHFETLPEEPVTRRTDRAALEALRREPLPERGNELHEVLVQLERDVLGNVMHPDHPRFFAFVPSPSNFVSVMADALAAGFNVFAGTSLEAAGPAQVELVTVDWLRRLCGLAEGAGGLFVSGGSLANLVSLATARHVVLADRTPEALVYFSDQTHSSVERALHVIGFGPEQLCSIPADERFRLPLAELERRVRAHRAAGRRPFCVVANAGAVNTGAVDPLEELADFCQREELWLHADGAFGAAAVLADGGRRLLAGLERVDSLSLDPHKWLFQPYEIGCVLVRDARHLPATFATRPPYLRDIDHGPEAVNFCDYGVQLTRSFRALKLWMSLKVFGLAAFRAAVARGLALAELAEEVLRGSPRWQVVTPAQLGVLTFRCLSSGTSPARLDALQLSLLERVIADGFAMLSSTVLRGTTVLRMCTINPRTTEEDIRRTVEHLDRLAAELGAR